MDLLIPGIRPARGERGKRGVRGERMDPQWELGALPCDFDLTNPFCISVPAH